MRTSHGNRNRVTMTRILAPLLLTSSMEGNITYCNTVEWNYWCCHVLDIGVHRVFVVRHWEDMQMETGGIVDVVVVAVAVGIDRLVVADKLLDIPVVYVGIAVGTDWDSVQRDIDVVDSNSLLQRELQNGISSVEVGVELADPFEWLVVSWDLLRVGDRELGREEEALT